MAFAYRLYKLFRAFWIQNIFACIVGGGICFLLLLLTQISYVYFHAVKRSLGEYYVQVLPVHNLAGNRAALDHVVEELKQKMPEIQWERHQDQELMVSYLTDSGMAKDIALESGLELPIHFIRGYLPAGKMPTDFSSRLRRLQAIPGVGQVDANVTFLEFMQQSLWAVPIGVALMGIMLVLLLFYILQFIISQLMVVHVEELSLEFLFGASQRYQKSPFLGFVLLFCCVSLGLGMLAWLVGVVPHVPNVMGWSERFGIEVGGITLLEKAFYLHHPEVILGFSCGFILLLLLIFGSVWNNQFRWIVLKREGRL